MRYAVVIEEAEGNLAAYVPDLPGCVTTGGTLQEIEQNIKEAIAFHLQGLKERMACLFQNLVQWSNIVIYPLELIC